MGVGGGGGLTAAGFMPLWVRGDESGSWGGGGHALGVTLWGHAPPPARPHIYTYMRLGKNKTRPSSCLVLPRLKVLLC
jgi:hypothetical protein